VWRSLTRSKPRKGSARNAGTDEITYRKALTMDTLENLSAYEIFTIREALTLLAEKTLAGGDTFNEIETIARLEQNFTNAYYLMKGIN
jgi:hypothetical protein